MRPIEEIRQAGKRMIERTLRLALGRPRRMAGQSLVLAYHNVVPDELTGRGDRSLHLSLSRFKAQLDLLEAHCRIRPLSELLQGTADADAPSVALTFDDAYRGAVTLALPELARRGLPATLFVAPGLLGSASFWWDELATEAEGLTQSVRHTALEIEAGRQERIRKSMVTGQAAASLPDCYGCATEEQLRALATHGSLVLGAHSWTHPNLAKISAEELEEELTRPLRWLQALGLPITPVLAYPYGLTSATVVSAVERSGYAAAFLVEGGWLPRTGRTQWALPRFNVPAGLTEDGLLLRLCGTIRA